MGRDNKQGHSKNKGALPQTPKNQKIAPDEFEAEIAQELNDFSVASPNATQMNQKK